MAELGWIGLRVVSVLGLLVLSAALLTWVERRLLGLWQDRYGPNRHCVSPFGRLLAQDCDNG
ncbi:NADH-quinone oxidoreductase subunit H [Marinobacterium aestuariivivens]|uniref:NADH-quinone oxidoreductase subunit H n=1 Tax=Marinobacterium aestuariivivens TaxID=1698799 RepID=A0ABW1ZYL3_9GAMM